MSAFRPLQPSSDSASSQDAFSFASDSGRTSPSEKHDPGDGKPRKRRAPSHVSQNACTNCKKARAKCDGQEPAPCTRCVSRSIQGQCHYEVHVKTAKEEMVRKIRFLEEQNSQLQESLRQRDFQVQDILKALGSDPHNAEAIQRLGQTQLTDRLTSHQRSPTSHIVGRYGPVIEGEQGRRPSMQDEMLPDASPQPTTGQRCIWTDVIPSEKLHHHLIALYFTWIHPAHMLFSEKHFTWSFRNGEDTHCSPALVNAVCAMGCLLVEDSTDTGDIDAKDLCLKFLGQAHTDIAKEDRRRLTFASTYAVLFLVELSIGQARKASSHLRLAFDALLVLEKECPRPSTFDVTYCGISSLLTLWEGLNRRSSISSMLPMESNMEDVESEGDDALWRPYRFTTDAAAPTMPSMAIETAKQAAMLSSILSETISRYCNSRERLRAKDILMLYGRFLQWKEHLPDALTVGEGVDQRKPHVLFLHVQYRIALCWLFYPLLGWERLRPTTLQHVRNIVLQNAREGVDVLEHHRMLYTSKFQSPLQALSTVFLCEVLLLEKATETARNDVVLFCMESLREAALAFSFAGPLQAIFGQMVHDKRFPVPEGAAQLMQDLVHGPEEILDACERLYWSPSLDIVIGSLDASVAAEFEEEWAKFIEARGAEADVDDGRRTAVTKERQQPASSAGSPGLRAMQINALVNP